MTPPIEVSPTPVTPTEIGRSLERADGVEKVTGRAAYAIEQAPRDALHAWLVTSTIARGRITAIDHGRALAHPGVVAVLDHTNAPRLQDADNAELVILQDAAIGYRGQIVALVLAETSEAAREGAALVDLTYAAEPHEAELREDTAVHRPESVNPELPTDTEQGDVDAALVAAEVVVEETYRTAYESNNPLEPHAVVATWQDDGEGPVLTLHDSTQGVHGVATALAPMFGLEPEQVRVTAAYVGGGFGSKGETHSHEVAAALAARAVPGRAVRLAVTRQQMFGMTGYRTATISRMRLGAHADGTLTAIEHRAFEQTSRIREYAEQTASPTRMMYAAAHRRTQHRLARLDVTVPSWMRAPGEMPGMFAHEVAMDDLAIATGVDPVELRVRNEPEVDPETGLPWNDRRLVECLERGAEAFGWRERPAEPRATLDGEWWVGTGVASATYPMMRQPGNEARVCSLPDGRYAVAIAAVDIGTGARTVLAQIAADALGCPLDAVELEIADTLLPSASVAGGSAGTSSWGSAIVAAAQQFRADHGDSPDPGVVTTAAASDDTTSSAHAMHSFGAVFAEARVHRLTGEIRVPRLHGTYSVGRVINPRTARSQLLGGLVMGLSAALFEESWRDPRFGHFVTQDLATYHVATHADVRDLRAEWLEEDDQLATPMGSRGIGEIGIVGSSAAVVNAVRHATGLALRQIPVTPDLALTPPPGA
ncbi:molybdopterin-dependent oxidoreductase [Nocardioides sp. dk4132]|uniref:xanthine dehydrogenase family protein molybdopterin-binding subunit n=1 Tax=unclassified Nocardioides TaxID=2615069 RepID=UPI001294CA8E|nr:MULTISPECIES: xanthine dehydrogenase family protein molybdopterin-binding subunit [unclassified Nocardioides]MQW75872.1 molybdopterin-dependent oxidoreductase [Nocardioides sp. dk4132]QGA08737.1 molybdopterin-dependent oxidoreductase [Nocardioides sp. dk884]